MDQTQFVTRQRKLQRGATMQCETIRQKPRTTCMIICICMYVCMYVWSSVYIYMDTYNISHSLWSSIYIYIYTYNTSDSLWSSVYVYMDTYNIWDSLLLTVSKVVSPEYHNAPGGVGYGRGPVGVWTRTCYVQSSISPIIHKRIEIPHVRVRE